jgi:hypothetical protein
LIGENGYCLLALVVKESKTVPSGRACGLTELIDFSLSTYSTFRRPVSEAPFLCAGLEEDKEN